MTDERFDWTSGPDVIVHEQRAVAVYPNTDGGIVIRGERSWDEERDTVIVVAPEHAVSLLYAVIRATCRPLHIVELAEGGAWRDVENPLPERMFPPAGKSDQDQDGAEPEPGPRPKPKDPTAAERQRRRRARLRNCHDGESHVTHDNRDSTTGSA